MSKLLRHFRAGATYFVTAVTQDRKPLMREHSELLRDVIQSTVSEMRCGLTAWAIMPDHLHMILTPNVEDLSSVLKSIKLRFSYQYRLQNNLYRAVVWQSRFWDHLIRDQVDLNRHIDYIHFNPVKHGHVSEPVNWEYSSFTSYVSDGYYSRDWGVHKGIQFEGNFGE